MEDFTLARLYGHQVPEMADFGLPDTVDAPETLLNTVGIPGQVIVDHEVSTLQVDAFACRVGGHQDLYILVLAKGFLGPGSLFPAQAAMNGDHGLGASEHGADALRQVVERITVFGKDDQFQ